MASGTGQLQLNVVFMTHVKVCILITTPPVAVSIPQQEVLFSMSVFRGTVHTLNARRERSFYKSFSAGGKCDILCKTTFSLSVREIEQKNRNLLKGWIT